MNALEYSKIQTIIEENIYPLATKRIKESDISQRGVSLSTIHSAVSRFSGTGGNIEKVLSYIKHQLGRSTIKGTSKERFYQELKGDMEKIKGVASSAKGLSATEAESLFGQEYFTKLAIMFRYTKETKKNNNANQQNQGEKTRNTKKNSRKKKKKR